MKFFSKNFSVLLLIFVSQFHITAAMEKPDSERQFSKEPSRFVRKSHEGKLLQEFLIAESSKDLNIYLLTSNGDLEKVIALAKKCLNDKRYFQSMYDSLQFYEKKVSDSKVKLWLMQIIEQAELTLAKRKSLLEQKGFGAERPINEPVQMTQGKHATLKRFLEAEKNKDIEFYKTRSNFALESVIPVAVSVMNNKNDVKMLSKELKMSDGELIKLLTNVIQNANYYLRPVEKSISQVEQPVSREISQGNIIFSNQTPNKLVNLWVSSGHDMWRHIQLLPLEDSPEVSPAKDTMIYLYVGSDDYVLTPSHDSIDIAKEVISYIGQETNKFVDLRVIKKFKIKANGKLLVLISPDSSINIIERS